MALTLLALGLAALGHTQTMTATLGGHAPSEQRPGLFRAGDWYFTPYLQVGALGVDTNVFYTATDRQADFTASGGPGLEIIRPFRSKSRLRLDGGLNYLWFARTVAQRRLNWYGSASLEFGGVKTSFVIEESYVGTYSRPSFEVDTRVQQETEGTTALLSRRLGDRWSLALGGSRQNIRTEDQDYLGTNLGDTLTRRQYDLNGEIRRAVSIKTAVVGGGEHSWYRFPRLPERDGESTLAYGGLRTDQTALISGHALGGYRWFHLEQGSAAEEGAVYANINATLNISPMTRVGALFTRDLDYSAFATAAPSPTVLNERLEVFFDKVLVGNVYLYLFLLQNRLITGNIVYLPPDGGPVKESRNDRVREAGVELGYELRPRLRMGVSAVYTERRSNIETFGISGLLAGFTITYRPPQPALR